MSRPRIIVFSGNIHRPSRSRTLAEAVGSELANRLSVDLRSYDVLDAGPGLGAAFGRGELPLLATRIVREIEGADALIVGTPVYKGAYTGLFKHLFDMVEPRALADKPVVITATGGGQRHALVVEHSLRPLFGFFNALTIPTAIYASESDFTDGQVTDASIQGRIAAAAQQLRDVLHAASSRTDTLNIPLAGPRAVRQGGSR